MKLLLLIVLVPIVSFSQGSKFNSIDIFYTSKMLDKQSLSDGMNSSLSYELGRPLNYVGIGISGPFGVNNNDYRVDGFIDYAQIVPQEIQLNDSTNGIASGFDFGTTLLGGDLFRNSDVFGLMGCFGFYTGRFRLKAEDKWKQKNPYFAPMVCIIPRFTIGKMSFHLKCSYAYDISRKEWKETSFYKSTDKLDLVDFSSSGFSFTFGIGVGLF